MQAEVVQLALDLLVREPDVAGFFGALTKTMVEESESHTCAVWLIDEDLQQCEPWMAYVKDRLFFPGRGASGSCVTDRGKPPFPCDLMARHLFDYTPGWTQTVEYTATDPRLPEQIRAFSAQNAWDESVATPLVIGSRTLGWMTVCSPQSSEPDSRWWRVVLIEAV